MPRLLIAMIVAFLLTVNARPAEAAEAKERKERNEGLYVGLDLVVNVPEQELRGDFAEVDPGNGFDVKLGYRFPIPFAVEINSGLPDIWSIMKTRGSGFS